MNSRTELIIVSVFAFSIVSVIVALNVSITMSTSSVGSTPVPPPTISPTTPSPPGELVVNYNFEGTLNGWTIVGGSGGDPYLGTYDPPTAGIGDSIKPEGANNYFMVCANAQFEYVATGAIQSIDVTSYQGQSYRFTYVPGGVTNGGGESIGTIEFYDSEDARILDPNLSLAAASVSYSDLDFNTNYIKTGLNGIISIGNEYEDNPSYAVYKATTSDNIVIINFATVGWRFYKGITWDVDDLVNGFDIGTDGVDYTAETYTASSTVRDMINYPSTSASGFVNYSDYPEFYFISTMRYNGVDYNDEFVEFSAGFSYLTIPVNAVRADVTIRFTTTSFPCNGGVDRFSMMVIA